MDTKRGTVMRCVVILFALLTIASCAKDGNSVRESDVVISMVGENRSVIVRVEVADTPQLWAQGLMFRQELAENSGMWFVFDKPSTQSFWMKNTLIPLDIIFVDENGTILNIEFANPCRAEPCTVFKSVGPAKFVLEVNQGFSAKNSVKVGNRVVAR